MTIGHSVAAWNAQTYRLRTAAGVKTVLQVKRVNIGKITRTSRTE